MATINETRLQAYIDAEAKILSGAQSVRLGDREITRANMEHIRDEIRRLQVLVAREQSAASGRLPFSRADLGGEW